MTAASEPLATRVERRRARAARVNELVVVIASCGRRFFCHEGRVARLEVDDRGRVWWVDDYTQKRIYTHEDRRRWRGFSHGGTLRDLVRAFRRFVCAGTLVRHFGPWPDWYSSGDPWGYGDDMQTVREAAKRLEVSP